MLNIVKNERSKIRRNILSIIARYYEIHTLTRIIRLFVVPFTFPLILAIAKYCNAASQCTPIMSALLVHHVAGQDRQAHEEFPRHDGERRATSVREGCGRACRGAATGVIVAARRTRWIN